MSYLTPVNRAEIDDTVSPRNVSVTLVNIAVVIQIIIRVEFWYTSELEIGIQRDITYYVIIRVFCNMRACFNADKLSGVISVIILIKKSFKETLNYICKKYSLNAKRNKRKDYITRTLILLCDKYKLNSEPKFFDYYFKK